MDMPVCRAGLEPSSHANTYTHTTHRSLIKNWANEIAKWLGDDPDLGVVAVTGACVHAPCFALTGVGTLSPIGRSD